MDSYCFILEVVTIEIQYFLDFKKYSVVSFPSYFKATWGWKFYIGVSQGFLNLDTFKALAEELHWIKVRKDTQESLLDTGLNISKWKRL